MEALRTRIDGLEWEVQRLTTENRKLREDNPGTSELVDREAELEKTRSDAAELTDRVLALERQLAENTNAKEDAESRAGRAETRAAELESLVETRRETQATAASEEVEELRATIRDRERESEKIRRDLSDWEHRWDDVERRNRAERETWLQQAELERYRALDEERRRYETRESRLHARLETVEEELRAAKATAANVRDNGHLMEQVQSVTSDLSTMQSLVDSLTAENSRLVRENETLGRGQGNLSVQEQCARLAGSRLDRERRDDGLVVGEGVGGEQTRGEDEEGLYSRDSCGVTTLMNFQTMPSVSVMRSTQVTGLD